MENYLKLKRRVTLGFTLVELLVVITIIGVLTAFGGANYTTSMAKGRDAERISELKIIAAAQEQYFGENGHYAVIADTTDLTCRSGVVDSFANSMISGGVIPMDPKPGLTQFYDCRYPLNETGQILNSAFCIEVSLESSNKSVIANCGGCNCESGASATDCSITAGSTHFCVKNQQ